MLHVDEIYEIDRQKKQIRKEIYKNIYETFTRKIRHCVNMNEKHSMLSVPSYVVGQPSFDRVKAASYLRRQLENGGFQVRMMSNVDMYVTWVKERDKEKRMVEINDPSDESDFTSLINLRKTAAKYKKK